MHVVIFGATRGTGLECASLLRQRGDQVTAVVRDGANIAALAYLEVATVSGDAFDPKSLTTGLAAVPRPVDAVICSLGNTPMTPRKVDAEGVAHVADACAAAGWRRFLLVSSIGAGNSRPALSPRALQFLGAVCALKTEGEDHLKGSGLDYTIVRPGGLGHGPASGRGRLSEDPMTSGGIARAELARLLVACLDDDATIGKVLSAVEA
jgi:uncharacterized protein YbjT (DUF2867 family)